MLNVIYLQCTYRVSGFTVEMVCSTHCTGNEHGLDIRSCQKNVCTIKKVYVWSKSAKSEIKWNILRINLPHPLASSIDHRKQFNFTGLQFSYKEKWGSYTEYFPLSVLRLDKNPSPPLPYYSPFADVQVIHYHQCSVCCIWFSLHFSHTLSVLLSFYGIFVGISSFCGRCADIYKRRHAACKMTSLHGTKESSGDCRMNGLYVCVLQIVQQTVYGKPKTKWRLPFFCNCWKTVKLLDATQTAKIK